MIEILRASFVAVLLLLYDPILKAFKSYGKRIPIAEGWVVAVTLVLMAFLYLLADFLARYALHLPGIRKHFFPTSRLEGLWYQTVENDRPHSLSIIKHDFVNRTWTYEGFGYSDDFHLRSQWKGVFQELDKNKNYLIFKGRNNPIDRLGEVRAEGTFISVIYWDTCEIVDDKIEGVSGRVLDLDYEVDYTASFVIRLHKCEEQWPSHRTARAHALRLGVNDARSCITDFRNRLNLPSGPTT